MNVSLRDTVRSLNATYCSGGSVGCVGESGAVFAVFPGGGVDEPA
ncbi:hypothetical protein [Anabaena cylindrica]